MHVSLRGCIWLDDDALAFLGSSCPGLVTVDLAGIDCITDKGILALVTAGRGESCLVNAEPHSRVATPRGQPSSIKLTAALADVERLGLKQSVKDTLMTATRRWEETRPFDETAGTATGGGGARTGPKPFEEIPPCVLRKLDITGCFHVGDRALGYLAARATQLRELIADGCFDVTDFGMAKLLELCRKMRKFRARSMYIIPSKAHFSRYGTYTPPDPASLVPGGLGMAPPKPTKRKPHFKKERKPPQKGVELTLDEKLGLVPVNKARKTPLYTQVPASLSQMLELERSFLSTQDFEESLSMDKTFTGMLQWEAGDATATRGMFGDRTELFAPHETFQPFSDISRKRLLTGMPPETGDAVQWTDEMVDAATNMHHFMTPPAVALRADHYRSNKDNLVAFQAAPRISDRGLCSLAHLYLPPGPAQLKEPEDLELMIPPRRGKGGEEGSQVFEDPTIEGFEGTRSSSSLAKVTQSHSVTFDLDDLPPARGPNVDSEVASAGLSYMATAPNTFIMDEAAMIRTRDTTIRRVNEGIIAIAGSSSESSSEDEEGGGGWGSHWGSPVKKKKPKAVVKRAASHWRRGVAGLEVWPVSWGRFDMTHVRFPDRSRGNLTFERLGISSKRSGGSQAWLQGWDVGDDTSRIGAGIGTGFRPIHHLILQTREAWVGTARSLPRRWLEVPLPGPTYSQCRVTTFAPPRTSSHVDVASMRLDIGHCLRVTAMERGSMLRGYGGLSRTVRSMSALVLRAHASKLLTDTGATHMRDEIDALREAWYLDRRRARALAGRDDSVSRGSAALEEEFGGMDTESLFETGGETYSGDNLLDGEDSGDEGAGDLDLSALVPVMAQNPQGGDEGEAGPATVSDLVVGHGLAAVRGLRRSLTDSSTVAAEVAREAQATTTTASPGAKGQAEPSGLTAIEPWDRRELEAAAGAAGWWAHSALNRAEPSESLDLPRWWRRAQVCRRKAMFSYSQSIEELDLTGNPTLEQFSSHVCDVMHRWMTLGRLAETDTATGYITIDPDEAMWESRAGAHRERTGYQPVHQGSAVQEFLNERVSALAERGGSQAEGIASMYTLTIDLHLNGVFVFVCAARTGGKAGSEQGPSVEGSCCTEGATDVRVSTEASRRAGRRPCAQPQAENDAHPLVHIRTPILSAAHDRAAKLREYSEQNLHSPGLHARADIIEHFSLP